MRVVRPATQKGGDRARAVPESPRAALPVSKASSQADQLDRPDADIPEDYQPEDWKTGEIITAVRLNGMDVAIDENRDSIRKIEREKDTPISNALIDNLFN